MLAWLLGEEEGESPRQVLASATQVVASELTVLEARRALLRHTIAGGIGAAVHARLRAVLETAAASWTRLAIDDAVLVRAGQPFPVEPLRSMDAIHLATAALAHDALGGLTVVSLDRRVRANVHALGLPLAPT